MRTLLWSLSSVQSLSRVRLFVTPWTAACQASLSITNSRSLNSCPLSQWCHPTISSSVVPFSSCLQSFPASGSFPMSQFFTSGVQSIGVSASVNIQDWFPLGWTGWISLQSKGISRVFSNITVQKYQFFGTQLSLYTCIVLTCIKLLVLSNVDTCLSMAHLFLSLFRDFEGVLVKSTSAFSSDNFVADAMCQYWVLLGFLTVRYFDT